MDQTSTSRSTYLWQLQVFACADYKNNFSSKELVKGNYAWIRICHWISETIHHILVSFKWVQDWKVIVQLQFFLFENSIDSFSGMFGRFLYQSAFEKKIFTTLTQIAFSNLFSFFDRTGFHQSVSEIESSQKNHFVINVRCRFGKRHPALTPLLNTQRSSFSKKI